MLQTALSRHIIKQNVMYLMMSNCFQQYTAVYFVEYFQHYPIRHHIRNSKTLELGDNCIQNFHLGRYIVGYTVGNLVLRRRLSRAVKRDFRTYIRRYTSSNESFEYGYPHSNALSTFSLQKDSENVLCCAYTSNGCQLHKTACQLHVFTCQPMESDVT